MKIEGKERERDIIFFSFLISIQPVGIEPTNLCSPYSSLPNSTLKGSNVFPACLLLLYYNPSRTHARTHGDSEQEQSRLGVSLTDTSTHSLDRDRTSQP